MAWREVPVEDSTIGSIAKKSQPYIMQVFIDVSRTNKPEQLLYTIRRVIENDINENHKDCIEDFYICSLSTKMINYKGMLLATQLPEYYSDLANPLLKTRLVVFHQRYSTNTFPSWRLAQPFRYIAHNGEINTLRGNINKMYAREKTMSSSAFGNDIKKLFPIVVPGGSDSAMFDNTFELLFQSGRSIEHSLMMMVPEAFGAKYYISEDRRAFYQ